MTAHSELEKMLDRGHDLLAGRLFGDARAMFAHTYATAVAAHESATAARALLGKAQAEFQTFRLTAAAEDAHAALELLKTSQMPQAKQAADLIAQIDHHLRLG